LQDVNEEMMLSGNPCSFHMLSLNSLANPSADVFSIVGIKWTILVNQSTATRILSYPCIKGNLVIKSANICIQGFSGIDLALTFLPAILCSFLFVDRHHILPHIVSPPLSLLATKNCE